MKIAAQPLNDPMNLGNFELSQEQWNFIFKFYPEYGNNPYEMMVWLYGQAKFQEDMYLKPSQGGVGVEADNEDETNTYNENKGFKNQQATKKDTKKT